LHYFSAKAVIAQPVTTETVQLSADVSGQVLGEAATAEEGATIVQAEDGKQLVSIGDGQYVELPEGYTLIQTDEGYIIGQPGATFVQVLKKKCIVCIVGYRLVLMFLTHFRGEIGNKALYRETESYLLQDKQASMHAPRFGTQSKQSRKQPFLRGIIASISSLKIEDGTS